MTTAAEIKHYLDKYGDFAGWTGAEQMRSECMAQYPFVYQAFCAVQEAKRQLRLELNDAMEQDDSA